MHGTPSTSIRANPSARDVTALTRPRLSVSIPRDVDQRERDLDQALEVVDGDALVCGVDVLHPVREVETGETALVEDVRVGGAAAEAVARRVAGALERRVCDPDDGLVVDAPEAQIGDGARGGGDRGTPLLRIHARVRGAAVEGDLERLRVRRTE